MSRGPKARPIRGGRIQRKPRTGPTYRTTIRRGGLLVLPNNLVAWRVGQRLYFSLIDGNVVISTSLKRAWAGRICSARIRSVRVPERHFSSKARSKA